MGTMCFLIWLLIPTTLHAVFEVDPAEEHFEGFGLEVDFGLGLVVWLGPGEATPLETFED